MSRPGMRACNNGQMIVDCAVYEGGVRQGEALPILGSREAASRCGGFVWLGLYDPTEDEFANATAEFDFHEMAVEDALVAHQRPKLDVYDDSLLIVLRTARYLDDVEEVEFGEILVLLGTTFIVVVRHGAAAPLTAVRKRLENDATLLALGPSAVLYGILDAVVDGYLPVVEGLDKDIRELEKEVFSDKENPAQRIYFLKREVLEFQQAVASLLDPLDRLARGHHGYINDDLREYLRDVHDHLLRIAGEVASFRELLTSILDANLAQVAVRQNEDMRRISAWVAVAAVPTLIAGVFGMNFDSIPWSDEGWGFFAVSVVMVAIAVTLYRLFRRSGWL
jgi:magnesium transporter